MPMFLGLLMRLSNKCLGLRCRPYRVFLGGHNISGWMNGHTIGGLMIVDSLSGRVVLQKEFLKLPCQRRCLCSMEMLVIWQRY